MGNIVKEDYSYVNSYIDLLDFSVDGKGKVRAELIKDIKENTKKQLKERENVGYKRGKDWAKLIFKRETAEKEDYVRMYFMLYQAITESNKSPEEILSCVVEYLDAEFDKVFKYYEDELPRGLVEDNPKDPKLLYEISERVKRREGILRGLVDEE